MTYRDRRLAKAERLRGWAEKREQRGTATVQRARELGSVIPFGQPILAGHHSQGRDTRYRERIGNTYDRGFADLEKGREMASRADGIEAAADRAIYSDDPDAIEQLEKRLAGLEAERTRVKAYNASARKGAPDLELLTARLRSGLEVAEKHTGGYQERRKHQLPPYVLENLSGNISRQRKRLEQLQRQANA